METSEQKDKYYTPKIEEFHVGFEYEVFQKGQPYDPSFMYLIPHNEKDEWCKFKHPDPFLGYNLEKMFKIYTLRIKHLDIEDIESLGWKEHKHKYYVMELPSSYPYHLHAVLDFRWSTHDISIDVVRSIKYRDSDEDQRIFRGTIKNKSKLKTLMKDLKILKDEE